MAEMEKNYNPKRLEDKWLRLWLERRIYHRTSQDGGDPYCVVIPPPNVTGILHMGHALNNTIQDILVRWRRMQGRNVVWIPGTDHAGIATQNVVERSLREEGKSREDLGRDAFIARVWKWREQYGGTIINQLKRLGASCDWDRERFTMDSGLSDAVAEVFVRLYDKGLIHKANYIINWCPRCHTALSDEESEHIDTRGKLYYIKYPVSNDDGKAEHIVVATTRPETLLGDVAVAVNPGDERYKDLSSKKIMLPILDRELVVIKDDIVDPKFGTGIVKVTPAHDPNDFEMGLRHNLTPINVMNGNGTMNEFAGCYAGMDRFECRKKILEDLKAAGLLEKVEDHNHAVGHCYRCDTVVEPRLSPQWFVKMKPLAERAIDAVKNGSVEFVPKRWTKVYLDWMENIRDWCISRQIWWGHRIPVFYCDACGHEWAAKIVATVCPKCGSGNVRQDEDVLDTWFSSWLWPFSTFGWPEAKDDLKFYYPTNDLVTASEIIFFWVARMIMAGLEFMGDVPFSKVYIHGTVRDDKGLKMSKSLGNSIDPLTIIEEFSADALRFSLMMITATGQDVFLSNDKFEIGRNFGTKLWNAARFMQMQGICGSGSDPAILPDLSADLLEPDDKHIIARLQSAIASCTENLEKYRFNDASLVLYEFIWHQFCDWYVEYAKSVLSKGDEPRRAQVMKIMNYIFSSALRLLHPMMPFITEEIWHTMGYGKDEDTIAYAQWPQPASSETMATWGMDTESVEYVEKKHDLVRAGRILRADYGITPSKEINYIIVPESDAAGSRMESDANSLKVLLRADRMTIVKAIETGKVMPSGLSKLGTIYMPLEGLIDIGEETKRLTSRLEKVIGGLERINMKLANVDFMSKAPKHVVEQQNEKKQELLDERRKLQQLLDTLKT
ncbi:MAG: valine--tRNA ligase [Lentisphaerae bacterium]|nr:valine--tRNA ligase [Lentisphaerota bacterium]